MADCDGGNCGDPCDTCEGEYGRHTVPDCKGKMHCRCAEQAAIAREREARPLLAKLREEVSALSERNAELARANRGLEASANTLRDIVGVLTKSGQLYSNPLYSVERLAEEYAETKAVLELALGTAPFIGTLSALGQAVAKRVGGLLAQAKETPQPAFNPKPGTVLVPLSSVPVDFNAMDDAGEPLRGIAFSVTRGLGDHWNFVSNGTGHADTRLTPGTYDVTACPTGYEPFHAKLVIPSPAFSGQKFDICLRRAQPSVPPLAKQQLACRFLVGVNRVAGVAFRVVLDDGKFETAEHAVTNAYGEFTVTVPPGKYRIQSSHAAYEPCDVPVNVPGGPHTLWFTGYLNTRAAAGTDGRSDLVGTVLDASTAGNGVTPGVPLGGVQVVITNAVSNLRTHTVYTDDAGCYQQAPLPPGTYHVTFTKEGFKTFTRDDVVVRPGRRCRLNVPLTPCPVKSTARVFGVVADEPTGKPIAQATVALQPVRPDIGGVSYYAKTDTEGRFAVEDITPGIFSLTTSAPGYRPTTTPGYELRPNGEVRFTSQLYPLAPRAKQLTFDVNGDELRVGDIVTYAGAPMSTIEYRVTKAQGTLLNLVLCRPIIGCADKLNDVRAAAMRLVREAEVGNGN